MTWIPSRGRLSATVTVFAMACALAPAASAATQASGGTITNPLAFTSSQALQQFSSGTASKVAVADLNGDGKPDTVALDHATGTATVIPNSLGTDQSFGASYDVGSGPTQLALADLNGDGHPDLVVVGNAGNAVVLLGNGHGTFGTSTSYFVGSHPAGLAVVDVNGDSAPDILVPDSQNNDVSVLLGNGDGTFAAPTESALGGSPTTMAVGDFNGDSHPDIAVTNYAAGTVTVVDGDGKGGFGSPQTFPAGDDPDNIAVGDFNGDGYPDLAVLDYPSAVADGTDSTQVLFNNGSSSTGPSDQFAAPSQLGVLPNQRPVGLPGIRVGDVDGDGILDVAVADGNDFVVYRGNGSGGFGSGVSVGTDPTLDFAIADMNGDGAPDFVLAADISPSTVAVNLHELPPTNSYPPTLDTNALVNQSVTGYPGTWDAVVFPDLQWQVQRCDQNGENCSDIPGDSGQGQFVTVSPTSQDVGSTLRVKVIATDDAGYSDPVYSNLTNVVPPPPAVVNPPTITGEPSAGHTITAAGDTWNMPVNRHYTWWICPAGDTDPTAYVGHCLEYRFSRSLSVPLRWAGYEAEAVISATNATHGTSFVATGLVKLLAITPTGKTLRAATYGQGYTAALTALGGTAPWMWSVASGSLPPGLSLDQSSGAITGTPSATGIYTFTVQASDSSSPALVATRTYSLTVNMAISPTSLAKATVGQSYGVNLTVSGGSAPYTWTLAPGNSLPDGLSLDPSSGAISGSPTTAGTYKVKVQVTDSSSPALTSSRSYTLKVLAAPAAS